MEKHHLVDGGEVTYFMTDPRGEKSPLVAGDICLPAEVARIHRRMGQPGWVAKRGIAHDLRAGAAERTERRDPNGIALHLRVSRALEQLERWGAFEVFPQSVAQMDALLETT